jgi:hypothetical protein
MSVKALCRVILVLALSLPLTTAEAQGAPEGSSWRYTLVHGSELLDDCPVCDRLSLPIPLRGTFDLRLIQANPLFATYALENIALAAGSTNSRLYQVTGKGTLVIGGELAVLQTVSMELAIDDGWGVTTCYLTNGPAPTSRRWPMLQLVADQTNGTIAQVFHLTMNAAPLRELWFSTREKFEAGIWQPSTNVVFGGDLLASSGRVVKRNHEITSRLGVQPPIPDLGLKDIDVLPGGELAFSIETSVFSETLGLIGTGDMLSDRGKILRTNFYLALPFDPLLPPDAEDIGLDALHVLDNGETLFSSESAFFSMKLGMVLQPGDLLSEKGTLYRSNRELLARFEPEAGTGTVGLSSVYVWPHGEIWFSPTKGFKSARGDSFASGDLLSDEGYVVYTNAELLANFQPTTPGADRGLDALFVVTDTVAPAPAPQLKPPTLSSATAGGLSLQWNGPGQVFQVEAASDPAGPFSAASLIQIETSWTDRAAPERQGPRFYRVRQW